MESDYILAQKAAIDSLAAIDPKKPFGTDLFNAIARVSVNVAIEAVCLRENSETKKIEVLLVKRAADDSAYPSQWHCPGSVLRPGESVEDVFARLSEKEFLGNLATTAFVGNFNNPEEIRGHFFSVIYLCETDGDRGTWCDIDKLPESTVKSHRDTIIPMSVEKFVGSK